MPLGSNLLLLDRQPDTPTTQLRRQYLKIISVTVNLVLFGFFLFPLLFARWVLVELIMSAKSAIELFVFIKRIKQPFANSQRHCVNSAKFARHEKYPTYSYLTLLSATNIFFTHISVQIGKMVVIVRLQQRYWH